MTFNEKLVKLRKLRGITQDEFASAVGVSRQAVYKWESGQSYPEVSKLIEIKALFNISIDDLLDDSYEVILPEKKKKRLSTYQKRAIENMVKKEEGISVSEEVSEFVAPDSTPEQFEVKETVPVSAETSSAETEKPAEEENEKKGFFKRLFGR